LIQTRWVAACVGVGLTVWAADTPTSPKQATAAAPPRVATLIIREVLPAADLPIIHPTPSLVVIEIKADIQRLNAYSPDVNPANLLPGLAAGKAYTA
jgi:hypothetical protein